MCLNALCIGATSWLHAIFKHSVHSLPILSWPFQTNTLIVGQQSYAVDFLIYAVITQMHTDIY